MQTLICSKYLCPVIGREVQVEELYHLESTCTCQIDTRLISWHCLYSNSCPNPTACPLYREYSTTGEESLPDQ
ncbi:hypothetical protein [Desulfoscipio sp. XC116]|uniref:hypothetical protein n=1 Tax=Desulfoscipio sp. XC116 TaxID=3144975 RepID=UPI00325BA317